MDPGAAPGGLALAAIAAKLDAVLARLPPPGAQRIVYTIATVAKLVGMKKADLAAAVRDGRVRSVYIEERERISQDELRRIQIEGIPAAPVGRPKRAATRQEVEKWRPGRG